jgi:hypothetical protein
MLDGVSEEGRLGRHMLFPDVNEFGFALEFGPRFPECKMLLMSAWDFEMNPPKMVGPRKVLH